MKVRCIDNSEGRVALTIDKEYEVIFERTNKYRVVNDEGIITEYIKGRFKEVKDMKFKVGDKVRVRKDLKIEESYGGYYFFAWDGKFKR